MGRGADTSEQVTLMRPRAVSVEIDPSSRDALLGQLRRQGGGTSPLAEIIDAVEALPEPGGKLKLDPDTAGRVSELLTDAPSRELLVRLRYHDAMQHALAAAEGSPDPSTQNGAALLDSDGNIISSDCNRFPNGVAETPERWERPLKYEFIEHAERNTIFKAARAGHKLEGATLVCRWAACADCARAIAQAGIKTLVRLPAPAGEEGHWLESIEVGDAIMREAGVEIIELDPSELSLPSLRLNGRAS